MKMVRVKCNDRNNIIITADIINYGLDVILGDGNGARIAEYTFATEKLVNIDELEYVSSDSRISFKVNGKTIQPSTESIITSAPM